MESKKLYGASTQMTPAVYKDFHKTYYNEKLKVFKIVAEIVGLIAIFGAFYILANGYGILWGAIALWIGAFLLFYPRMIYRKPYKNAKDNSQTTHFAFFENYMSEKTKSHVNEYKYDDIQKVLETGKYFFIFHNSESVSIVDKAHFSGEKMGLSKNAKFHFFLSLQQFFPPRNIMVRQLFKRSCFVGVCFVKYCTG